MHAHNLLCGEDNTCNRFTRLYLLIQSVAASDKVSGALLSGLPACLECYTHKV